MTDHDEDEFTWTPEAFASARSASELPPAVKAAFPRMGHEARSTTMTPSQVYAARSTLAKQEGRDKPLSRTELGRMLRLRGATPGATVTKWEDGSQAVSGPASLALEALLSGWRPKP